MTTPKLPGTDAARHGAGDADLTIMIAAHEAFRRDLISLARAANAADLTDPARQRSFSNGWEVFKRQLHIHHTAEDELIWPLLRERLADSENALSVLGAMEAEHEQVDPLLAAVDAAFAAETRAADVRAEGAGRLDEVIEPLVSTLTNHLAHEEKDALPLIGVTMTAAEWRAAGRKIAVKNLPRGPEMFAWMLHDAPAERAGAAIGTLPPPARLLYRRVWKPRYEKTARW